jgi:hypothetical protein
MNTFTTACFIDEVNLIEDYYVAYGVTESLRENENFPIEMVGSGGYRTPPSAKRGGGTWTSRVS